jgi:hypothetical protein
VNKLLGYETTRHHNSDHNYRSRYPARKTAATKVAGARGADARGAGERGAGVRGAGARDAGARGAVVRGAGASSTTQLWCCVGRRIVGSAHIAELHIRTGGVWFVDDLGCRHWRERVSWRWIS